METKETPFLDFYYGCFEEGERMPCEGLCLSFVWEKPEVSNILHLFIPTDEDWVEYRNEMFDDGDDIYGENIGRYWASESRVDNCPYEFNKTRQTIVLLCAAMNGEL